MAESLDVTINQCGRLIANVVIAYNSIMLSMLLDKYKAAGNEKVIALLQKISPWLGNTFIFWPTMILRTTTTQSTLKRF
jgi:hypothetical protein